MADSQTKITVHSLPDLKNTSDDAIPNYLNSLKFKQSHVLSDVRLALGYSAFALSAACFYWDYKFGFEDTKYYTAAAVAVYTCLNGLLTLWIWLVEKGKVYVGTSPSGDRIEISTSTKKHIPVYNVTVSYYTSTQPQAPHTVKIARPFMQWFDSAGHFVPLPFQQMFAGEVPIIGAADPTKVITGDKVAQSTMDGGTFRQAAVDIMAASGSPGVGESPRKGGRARKRA